MSGAKAALKIKDMTPSRMLKELVLYSVLLNILQFIAFYGLFYVFQSLPLGLSVVFASLAVLMFAMTSFIFYRFWVYPNNKRNSIANDDFQKLVGLVALVFCCCQVNTAVWWGYRAYTLSNETVINSDDLWYMNFANFGVIANSAVNLFIYLLGSSSFRRVSCRLFGL